MQTKVILFSVKDAASKCRALQKVTAAYLTKKEKLKICVPDQTTMDFVDQLLWKDPPTSFLPHSCGVPLPFQDFIYLSLPLQQMDDYLSVFNLCPAPYSSPQKLKYIYELEDLSHPQKKAIFQNKFQVYQKAGFILCST